MLKDSKRGIFLVSPSVLSLSTLIFATHAMGGMVTDVVIDAQQIARMAYELADAMMKERGINRGQ